MFKIKDLKNKIFGMKMTAFSKNLLSNDFIGETKTLDIDDFEIGKEDFKFDLLDKSKNY